MTYEEYRKLPKKDRRAFLAATSPIKLSYAEYRALKKDAEKAEKYYATSEYLHKATAFKSPYSKASVTNFTPSYFYPELNLQQKKTMATLPEMEKYRVSPGLIGGLESKVSSLEEAYKLAEKNYKKAQSTQNKKDMSNSILGGTSSSEADKKATEEAKAKMDEAWNVLNEWKNKLYGAQYNYYNSLLKSNDFGLNSGYKSTANGDQIQFVPGEGLKGYNDLKYEYINNPNVLRDSSGGLYNPDLDMELGNELKEMTKNEKAIYNYLYNTQGKDSAEKYLTFIRDPLNRRMAEAIAKQFKNPFQRVLFSVDTSLEKASTDIADMLTGNETPTSAKQYAGQIVREDLGGFGKFAYDALGAATYMAPSILVSTAVGLLNPAAGAATGAALMGGMSGKSAEKEALSQGYAPYQAKAYGTLVGTSEAVLQYLLGGIGKLGGKLKGSAFVRNIAAIDNAFLRVSAKLGRNAFGEGAEEGLQAFLEPLFRTLALGEEYTPAQIEDIMYEALVGAALGGLMEAGGTVSSDIRTQNVGAELKGADLQQVIIDTARNEGNKLADVAQKRLNTTGKTSNYMIGEIFSDVDKSSLKTNIEGIATARREALDVARTEQKIREAFKRTNGFTAVTSGKDSTVKKLQRRATDTKANMSAAKTPEQRARIIEDTGRRYGVSETNIATAKRLSETANRTIRFFDNPNPEVHGYRDKSTNEIFVNANSNRMNLESLILAHEFTHTLEGTKAYKDLENFVMDSYKRDGKNIDTLIASKKGNYSTITKLDDAGARFELVAEGVEKYVLPREKDIYDLVRTNKSLAEKLSRFIDKHLSKMSNKAKERVRLEKAKQIYAKALAESNAPKAKPEAKAEPKVEAKATETKAEKTVAKETKSEPKTETKETKKAPTEAKKDLSEEPTVKKVSDARTNTLDNFFGDVEKDMDGFQESEFTYDVISEKKSLEQAKEKLSSDIDGEYNRLKNADGWSGTDLDEAMGILSILQEQAHKTGDEADYKRYSEWAKIVQEHATRGGQFLQSFAKYNRSPMGAFVKYVDGVNALALSDSEKQKLIKAASQTVETLSQITPSKTTDGIADEAANIIEKTPSKRAKAKTEKKPQTESEKAYAELLTQYSKGEITRAELAEKIKKLKSTETSNDGKQYSYGEVVDKNGIKYGMGVILDRNFKSKDPQKIIDEVKGYIRSLGGTPFTVYDKKGKAEDIIIPEKGLYFTNANGERRHVNQHLEYPLDRQRAKYMLHLDEIVKASKPHKYEPAQHPHDWLDNYGKNDWELRYAYVQELDGTVWKLWLRIPTSDLNKKYLYNVTNNEKNNGTTKSSTVIGTGARKNYSTSPVKANIPQNKPGVNPQIDSNSAEYKTVAAIVKLLKDKSMLDGSATQNKQFSYSSDKELANLTREQYNNFGWVRDNDIISAGYWKNFTSKYASAVNLKHHFEKTKDGEYMIPAYDEYDTSGIEDVVVFASGSINNPNVTKIIKIDLHEETLIEEKRRELYEAEGRGIQQETSGVFRRYNKTDFVNEQRYQGTGNKRLGYNDRFNSERGTSKGWFDPIVRYQLDDENGVEVLTYRSGKVVTKPLNDNKQYSYSPVSSDALENAVDSVIDRLLTLHDNVEVEKNINLEAMAKKDIADVVREAKKLGADGNEYLKNVLENEIAVIYDLDKALVNRLIDAYNQYVYDSTVDRARRFYEDSGKEFDESVIQQINDGRLDLNAEILKSVILRQAETRKTDSKRAKKALEEIHDVKFLYDVALDQMMRIADDFKGVGKNAPRSERLKVLGSTIGKLQTLAQLQNLRTDLRNRVSNNTFDFIETLANDSAIIPDLILSTMTKRRTVGLESPISKTRKEGAREAKLKSQVEVGFDVSGSNESGKYENIRGGRSFKAASNNAMARTLSKAEALLGYSLSTSDAAKKGAVTAEVERSLQPFVEKGYMTAEEAKQIAKDEARYRTFQDENIISKYILGLAHDLFNLAGIGSTRGTLFKTHEFGLGDFLVKYRQVPGAIVMRAIEFSPTGYLKFIWHLGQLAASKGTNTQAQRKAALSLSRATTGTGLITLAVWLAVKGLLKYTSEDEDKDVAALNSAEGLSGMQINFSAIERAIKGESTDLKKGDVLYDISFLEPFDVLLTTGASLANAEDETAWEKLGYTIDSSWRAIADLPALQTIGNLVDAFTYKEEGASDIGTLFLSLAESSITSFTPALVRQTAQAIDKNYRDTYADKNPATRIWRKFATGIPGARQTVPEKLDNFGEDKVYTNTLLNILNAYANPGNANVYSPNEVSEDYRKVYEESGESNFFPDRSAPYNVAIGGQKYALTADERAAYQKRRGGIIEDISSEIFDSKWFSSIPAEDKADMLSSIKEYANYEAMKEYAESKGITYTNTKWDGFVEKYDSIKNKVKFTDMLRARAYVGLDRYVEIISNGVSKDQAYDLALGLDSLTPEEGKTTVSSLQRYKSISSSNASDEEKYKALLSIMTETESAKLRAGYEYGLDPDVYVDFKQALKDNDKGTVGSYTKDEYKDAIDDATNDRKTKALLWLLTHPREDPSKNPYNKSTARKAQKTLLDYLPEP